MKEKYEILEAFKTLFYVYAFSEKIRDIFWIAYATRANVYTDHIFLI